MNYTHVTVWGENSLEETDSFDVSQLREASQARADHDADVAIMDRFVRRQRSAIPAAQVVEHEFCKAEADRWLLLCETGDLERAIADGEVR